MHSKNQAKCFPAAVSSSSHCHIPDHVKNHWFKKNLQSSATSNEIVWGAALLWHRVTTVRCWVIGDDGLLQALCELNDTSLVTTAVTIVGSTEDSEDIIIMVPLVTVHHKLVSTDNEVEAIGVVELL